MNDNTVIIIFLAAFLGLLGFALLIKFLLWVNDFKYELKYIKTEIERSKGRENRYWVLRKYRLWLSLIPFVKYKK